MPKVNTKKRKVIIARRGANNLDPLVVQLGAIIARSPYTYKWIAERSDVSHVTLYNWVNQRVGNPQMPKVARVLRTLGCDLLIVE